MFRESGVSSSSGPTPVISTSSSTDSGGVVVPVPITLKPPNFNPNTNPYLNSKPDPKSDPKPGPKPDPKLGPKPTPDPGPDPSKPPQNTPTGGGNQPSNIVPSPTPAPDDCDDPKTADRCTASCIASTASPDTTLTTACTTTVCGKDIGCNAAPTTISEIRTKKDSPACTLAPQLNPDGPRQLANPQEIMDGADDLEDLLAKLDPDLIENGDAPASPSGTPSPTTLETSIVPSAPPQSSSTPKPPPPPSPSALTDRWTIHVNQQMDGKFSQVLWTLTDSNGKDHKKGQGSPLIAPDLPIEIHMGVRDPTNKDETKITWQYRGRGCFAEWSTGTLDTSDLLFPRCKGDTDFKCDNESIEWQPWNGGFQRFFDCRIRADLGL